MSFEEILNRILQHEDVESVIFLDSEGEEIFSYGPTDHHHLKLMGAYQGIVLNSIHRLELGENHSVVTICGNRSIYTHQLKLGYFVCILLSDGANFAQAQFQFQDYLTAMSNEL